MHEPKKTDAKICQFQLIIGQRTLIIGSTIVFQVNCQHFLVEKSVASVIQNN